MKRVSVAAVLLLVAGLGFSQAINSMDVSSIEIVGQSVPFYGSAYEGLRYKDILISLTIIGRDDTDADMDSWTWRKSFVEMEEEVAADDDISAYFFNIERELISLDTGRWVDSLVLSMFELEDQQFTRRLITTTDNYFLVINLTMDRPQLNQVYREIPDYFPIRSGYRIWSDRDAAAQLAKLILAGDSGSPTVDEWYLQTEEIVDSIILR